MDRFISILGVLIAIMLITFAVVGKSWSAQQEAPGFASCDQIEDSARRTVCLKDLAFKNLDVSPCLEIEKVIDRDICMRNIALKTRDGSLCQQISTADIRRICIEGVG